MIIIYKILQLWYILKLSYAWQISLYKTVTIVKVIFFIIEVYDVTISELIRIHEKYENSSKNMIEFMESIPKYKGKYNEYFRNKYFK